jgi:hypothetical protein
MNSCDRSVLVDYLAIGSCGRGEFRLGCFKKGGARDELGREPGTEEMEEWHSTQQQHSNTAHSTARGGLRM